jgi:hypothetical protein
VFEESRVVEPLVFRNARFKYVLLLLISAGFAGSGIFLLFVARNFTNYDRWTARFVVLFFGTAVVVFARQIFDTRPRLKIDDLGIDDRTLGIGPIPWSEIVGSYRQSIDDSEFICLELRNPEIWIARLSPAKRALVETNRKLGFSEFNINLSGVEGDAEQIHQVIISRTTAMKRTD